MQPTSLISTTDLTAILESYRFHFVTEKDLQDGIEKALKENGIDCQRETSISKASRPDFLVDGIAIEVKIKGQLSQLLRQIDRYAVQDDVKGVLVVGTPRWIHAIPQRLCEKEVRSLRLIGSLL